MEKENKKDTKLCKHCKTEIPKDAKVCPNCRKKQKGIGKWIAIAVVVITKVIAIVDNLALAIVFATLTFAVGIFAPELESQPQPRIGGYRPLTDQYSPANLLFDE